MSSNAAGDVNNRDESLNYVFNELEADAADDGYLLSRLERLREQMTSSELRGPLGVELQDLIGYVAGKQRRYLGELARLRTPED